MVKRILYRLGITSLVVLVIFAFAGVTVSAGGGFAGTPVDGSGSESAPLNSITVTPPSPIINVGGITPNATVQFAAVGKYSDGNTIDITSLVTWTSSDTAIATISTSGLATGAATGTANTTTDISASYSGILGNVVVLTVENWTYTLSSTIVAFGSNNVGSGGAIDITSAPITITNTGNQPINGISITNVAYPARLNNGSLAVHLTGNPINGGGTGTVTFELTGTAAVVQNTPTIIDLSQLSFVVTPTGS